MPSRWLWAIGLLGALALGPPSSHAQSLLQVVPDTLLLHDEAGCMWIGEEEACYKGRAALINRGTEPVRIDSLGMLCDDPEGIWYIYYGWGNYWVTLFKAPDYKIEGFLYGPGDCFAKCTYEDENGISQPVPGCVAFHSITLELEVQDTLWFLIRGVDMCPMCKRSGAGNVQADAIDIPDVFAFYQQVPFPDTVWLAVSWDSLSPSAVEPVEAEGLELQAYPQPFRERVHLALSARRAGLYEVVIWDVLGREQARWRYQMVPGARREWSWRAGASGVYLVGIFRDGRLLAFRTLISMR